jgi:peptidoglycan-associated lipoprotein
MAARVPKSSDTVPPSAPDVEHGEIVPLGPISQMEVIYFDFDKSDIRKDQLPRIEGDLKFLKDNPNVKAMISGHCDERGTTEYNFALGERRAQTVMNYFVNNGIPASRLSVLSKGEEEPAVQGHDESAWAKNRRCEFMGVR